MGRCRQYTYRFARHLVELFPGFIADQPYTKLPPASSMHMALLLLILVYPSWYLIKGTGSHSHHWKNIIQINHPQVSEKTVLELFQEARFEELWDECSDLKDVIVYCRGSKRLRIPESWRSVLPTELWPLGLLTGVDESWWGLVDGKLRAFQPKVKIHNLCYVVELVSPNGNGPNIQTVEYGFLKSTSWNPWVTNPMANVQISWNTWTMFFGQLCDPWNVHFQTLFMNFMKCSCLQVIHGIHEAFLDFMDFMNCS